MLLFSRHSANMLLLEVGLGGRLDATSVVERPLATVITPVSIDHTEHLGDSLGKIAAEKSGILKCGVPAIVAPQIDEALRIIATKAASLGAPLNVAGTRWVVGEEHGRLVYRDDCGLLDLPGPSLKGRHQFDNAGAAIAALRSVEGLNIPTEALEAGLAKAAWPARLQQLTRGRLAAAAPRGSEIWLDGAHNPAGAHAVAVALGDLERQLPRPILLVVGMLATKDCEGFLGHFTSLAHEVIAVPMHQETRQPPETIAAAADRAGIPAQTSQSVADAITAIADLDLEPTPHRAHRFFVSRGRGSGGERHATDLRAHYKGLLPRGALPDAPSRVVLDAQVHSFDC
jgi:dihydrofolate synthase / folylpolyglutamate synthase